MEGKHICSYGCGKEATHQFKNGKWCCSKYVNSCPSNTPMLGKHHSENTKRKIGNSKLGKPRDENTKRKLSKFRKGKTYEELLGKEKSIETKRKLSFSGKGRIPHNIGKPHTEETKRKIGLSCTGEKNGFYNKNHSSETKIKIKNSWTKDRRDHARKEMINGKGKYVSSFVKPETNKKRKQSMMNGGAAYLNSFIKNPSKPQVELYNRIKELYPSAILNYPCYPLNCSLDVAIPELKIWFESDGSWWHQDRNSDLERQGKIEELGWKCIRYYPVDDIKHVPSLEKIIEDIKNVR